MLAARWATALSPVLGSLRLTKPAVRLPDHLMLAKQPRLTDLPLSFLGESKNTCVCGQDIQFGGWYNEMTLRPG